MKTYEILPTDKNLVQTLIDDTIGRDSDVFRFVNILNSIDCSYSVALDGRWGSGKTFFVKQAKLVLDANNEHLAVMDADVRKKVLTSCQKFIPANSELQPQVCVYYDAWENDNDEDPVLSLIYTILTGINSDYSFSEGKDVLSIAASIGEFFTGRNIAEILKELRSASPLDSLKSKKELREKVNEFFNSLLPEKGNRLIIMVDELDRCKPSYAVKLLERIKHYFTNDRITFVFSVNTYELEKTIRKYYGDDFDAGRYLSRFFDLHISIPPVNMRKYYEVIAFSNSLYQVDQTIDAVIKAFGFELREISKYFPKVKAAVYQETHGDRCYEYAFPEEKALHFGLRTIVPVMIGLQIYDSAQLADFIDGKNYEPLIAEAHRADYRVFSCLLEHGESFNTKENPRGEIQLDERLKKVYYAIFGNVLAGTSCLQIGKLEFGEDIREKLLRAAGLFTSFSDYTV